MKVVVCGPEGSGTRALMVNTERLCEPYGIEVRHFSLPLGDWWWGPEDVAGEVPIVITRRPDYQNIAAWKQGCTGGVSQSAEEWPRAIEILSRIPDAHWVLYEAMLANASFQLQNLCRHLGIAYNEKLLERGDKWWPWRDENKKYEGLYRVVV